MSEEHDAHVAVWNRLRDDWLRYTLIMPWSEYLTWFRVIKN